MQNHERFDSPVCAIDRVRLLNGLAHYDIITYTRCKCLMQSGSIKIPRSPNYYTSKEIMQMVKALAKQVNKLWHNKTSDDLPGWIRPSKPEPVDVFAEFIETIDFNRKPQGETL